MVSLYKKSEELFLNRGDANGYRFIGMSAFWPRLG